MSDEVHFQLYGSTCGMWIPPELKDPILLHHPTRESTGYFGAVRLRDGKFTYQREDGSFNGETFFSFLKHVRRISTRAGRKVILVLDNARYHHAKLHKEWRKKNAAAFKIEYLPPYSPELNMIERMWKLTRRRCLHNQYFPSLESVAESVEELFIFWKKPNETLRKLCAFS